MRTLSFPCSCGKLIETYLDNLGSDYMLQVELNIRCSVCNKFYRVALLNDGSIHIRTTPVEVSSADKTRVDSTSTPY